MPSMQYDVKSQYATASGVMVPGRVRLKGAFCSAAVTSPGSAIFLNNATLAGTYARATTVATLTVSKHDLIVGDWVYIDFAAGGPTDGVYQVVTVADENTFTVTVADSGGTSGSVSIYNDVLLQLTVSTVSSSTVVIPGEGILAADGIRVILNNSVTATVFYG
jgi:hypothetical protein